MTLVDGCVLVGPIDNRLVKRTTPIMNGEEQSILSAFSYPLPLANAVAENGHNESVDSNHKADTAHKSDDLKNNVSKEDSRTSSKESISEDKPASKLEEDCKDLQPNCEKSKNLGDFVKNICDNVLQLAENINLSQSNESHISSTDVTESTETSSVNTFSEETSSTSLVETINLNGTPGAFVKRKSDDSLILSSQTLVNNIENNSTLETQNSPVMPQETKILNAANQNVNLKCPVQTSTQIASCENGDSYIKESSSPCKGSKSLVDGDVSFESECEEMILQIDEDELLESDFQPAPKSPCKLSGDKCDRPISPKGSIKNENPPVHSEVLPDKTSNHLPVPEKTKAAQGPDSSEKDTKARSILETNIKPKPNSPCSFSGDKCDKPNPLKSCISNENPQVDTEVHEKPVEAQDSDKGESDSAALPNLEEQSSNNVLSLTEAESSKISRKENSKKNNSKTEKCESIKIKTDGLPNSKEVLTTAASPIEIESDNIVEELTSKTPGLEETSAKRDQEINNIPSSSLEKQSTSIVSSQGVESTPTTERGSSEELELEKPSSKTVESDTKSIDGLVCTTEAPANAKNFKEHTSNPGSSRTEIETTQTTSVIDNLPKLDVSTTASEEPEGQLSVEVNSSANTKCMEKVSKSGEKETPSEDKRLEPEGKQLVTPKMPGSSSHVELVDTEAVSSTVSEESSKAKDTDEVQLSDDVSAFETEPLHIRTAQCPEPVLSTSSTSEGTKAESESIENQPSGSEQQEQGSAKDINFEDASQSEADDTSSGGKSLTGQSSTEKIGSEFPNEEIAECQGVTQAGSSDDSNRMEVDDARVSQSDAGKEGDGGGISPSDDISSSQDGQKTVQNSDLEEYLDENTGDFSGSQAASAVKVTENKIDSNLESSESRQNEDRDAKCKNEVSSCCPEGSSSKNVSAECESSKTKERTVSNDDLKNAVENPESSTEGTKEVGASFEDLCEEELMLDDESNAGMEERDNYQVSEATSSLPNSPMSESDGEDENNDDPSLPLLIREHTTVAHVSDDEAFDDESSRGCDELNYVTDQDKIKNSEASADNNKDLVEEKHVRAGTEAKMVKEDDLKSLNPTAQDTSMKETLSNFKVSADKFFQSVSVESSNEVNDSEISDSVEGTCEKVLGHLVVFVSENSEIKDEDLTCVESESEAVKTDSSFDKLLLNDHLYSASPTSEKAELSGFKRSTSTESEDESSIKRARAESSHTSKRKLSYSSEDNESSDKKPKMEDSSQDCAVLTNDLDKDIQPSKKSSSEDVEIGKFNRFQTSLRNFTRKDLEELIVLKMLEVMKYKGIAGDQQKKLVSLQDQCDTQKKLLMSIKKQYNENTIIMKKFIEQSQCQQRKNIVIPMKATRSVGLQVALADPANLANRFGGASSVRHISAPSRPLSISSAKPIATFGGKPKSVVPPVQSVSSPNQPNSSAKTKQMKTLVPPQNISSPPKTPGHTLKVLPPKANPVNTTPPLVPTRFANQTPNQFPTTTANPKTYSTKSSNMMEVIDLVEDSQQQARSLAIQNLSNKGLTVSSGQPGQQISYVVTSGTQVPIYISPTMNQGTRMMTSTSSRGVLGTNLKNGQLIQLQNKSGVLAANQLHILANSSQLKQVIRPIVNVNAQKVQQGKHLPRILDTRLQRPPHNSHPAPLPAIATPPSDKSWKFRPPKPTLRIGKNSAGTGITLSWTLNGYDKERFAEIVSYQLFAYQEGTEPPSTDLWKKVGDVKALPLPMACTLTKFVSGHRYHFAVQAVDIHSRVGEYSTPDSILLN